MALERVFRAVGSTPTSPALDRVKVVTYNLLAHKYAVSGMHAYCEKPLLAWERRGHAIKAEITAHDSDLLCLQEVDEASFQVELSPWMDGRGFCGLYAARKAGAREDWGPDPEGVALFWRRSMFRHVADQGDLLSQDLAAVLGDRPSGRSKGQHFWGACAQREEVALLALLEHLPSHRQVLASATHLFWNPQWPDIKAVQAALLCHQVARFLQQQCGTLDVPLLVGGDFNSLWRKWASDHFDQVPEDSFLTSGVYTLLSTGSLAAGQADHPFTRRGLPPAALIAQPGPLEGRAMHASHLHLTSMHLQAHGREPVLTTKTNNFAGCLDYIWVSPHWSVVETLSLPYDEPPEGLTDAMAAPFPAIPDAHFPSDHLAMGCVLELRPPLTPRSRAAAAAARRSLSSAL